MAQLTEKQLNEFLLQLNSGINLSYFSPARLGKMPRKEVIEEAKGDIEKILSQFSEENTAPLISRIRKYKEILDLSIEIAGEDFIRNEGFTSALNEFILYYTMHYKDIIAGNKFAMLGAKYKLLARKGELQNKLEFEKANGPIKRLVDLATNYLELLKIS